MKLPRFIFDRLLRRKLALARTPLDRVTVRLARTVDDYEGAFRLVQSAYITKGIENVLASTLRITPQHVLPEAYVLIAEAHGQIVGTMTVTLDSPAGLPLDKDYPEALGALRAQDLRLCEFGSLAITERFRHRGVTNLINFAALSIASQKLQADRVVLGVNPKATAHYRATFNAVALGTDKAHAQLSAPVAGMSIDLTTLYAFLRRAYPEKMRTGLFPADHCFGAPLPCIELPPGTHQELVRWKLSREVFQELFLRRSDRVETLDPRTRQYLDLLRTPATVGNLRLPRLTVVGGMTPHD